MNKNFIFAIVTVLLIFPEVNAQQNFTQPDKTNNKDTVKTSVAKVITGFGVHNLGIAVFQERNIISRKFSIFYGGGVYYSYFNASIPPLVGVRFINVNDNKYSGDFITGQITPYLLVALRRYISLENQGYSGNQLYANSGSYVGIGAEVPLGNDFLTQAEPDLEMALPVGVKVGLRRSLSKKFMVDSNVGIMAKVGRENILVVPRINLWLAYMF